MKVSEIRKKFIDFFISKNHVVVPSSSLIPTNDPSLMFTNSGMVQFKERFLGLNNLSFSRAVSVQRCLRAGGKHNDLENVGYTSRHHTFFEMLGNFSFGDYFKREAIYYAWELLTKVFGLPPEKLLITVYYKDFETFDIWTKEIGLDASKVILIGDNKGLPYASDNFWTMADTGPCGPCSEIFYDHGSMVAGGPPGSSDENGDRFVEIWNIVFMQFDQTADGSMKLLPTPCVDTGMGLERIAAVLQGVHSNYEIDLFKRLIGAAGKVTACEDLSQNSLKVIADHIRSAVFMISDGIFPGNEGRNYVLRRIIRRAVRHGYQLDCHKPFFSKLVDNCVEEMGCAYPGLTSKLEKIKDIVFREELRFLETLSQGMTILNGEISHLVNEKLANNVQASFKQVLPGNIAFKLHDTYGFPLDLTADICRENGLEVDAVAFEQAMIKQKELARSSGKFKAARHFEYSGQATSFVGYDEYEVPCVRVQAIYLDCEEIGEFDVKSVVSLKEGQKGIVVLDLTPFYAESGGQVGDSGELIADSVHFNVDSTLKIRPNVFGHKGKVSCGEIYLGQHLCAKIDIKCRLNIARHHSGTHLLHGALRHILGDHIQQCGSFVDNARIRFDFSHPSPISMKQLRKIERFVNDQILMNTPAKICLQSLEDALSNGAIGLFAEKYNHEVRVVQLGFSKELCGGTHVQSTGEIGLFKILSESGVASGVRRIEAVSGDAALDFFERQNEQIEEISSLLHCRFDDALFRLRLLLDHDKIIEKQLNDLKKIQMQSTLEGLKLKIKDLGKIKTLMSFIDLDDPKTLKNSTLTLLKGLGGDGIVILATEEQKKANVVVCVSDRLSKVITANEIITIIRSHSGGKGGGSSTVAQAGGVMATNLPLTFKFLLDKLEESFRKSDEV